MIKKVNRLQCLKEFTIFPTSTYDPVTDEENNFYPKTFASHKFSLNVKSFRGLSNNIGIEIAKVSTLLGWGNLYFLGDRNTAWLYQYNEYKPAKEAYDYLSANKIGKRFNGAIVVDIADQPTFFKHLTWLTRCNAALPSIHFTNKKQSIIGYICKYGILHMDTLNKMADTQLKEIIPTTKLQSWDNDCHNYLSKTSMIPGRRITI